MVLTRYDNQGRTHKAAKALSAECIFDAVQNHKGNCSSLGRLPEVDTFSISWWLVSSNLGHLEEILLRVDPNSLRGSGLSQVWAGHFAIHQEALAQRLLCESDHLVDGWRGNLQQLRQSAGEAQTGGHVLSQVAILQVGHEASIHRVHGMSKPNVGAVGVHGQLQSGIIGHLPLVAVQVPAVQGARILQVEAGDQCLHLPAHILDFI
mmetsp:Transcript_58416/g.92508  ORF Transcript_58416/g.92508 Transcript_58416/m.92508 type:complete len:207 (-) Transcript_58416:848-1468(-)